jgi:hypothetical protein
MNAQQSESSKAQARTNLNRHDLDNIFSDPFQFYKTLSEFPKHEKLIKVQSAATLLYERPKTARCHQREVFKEEKAINTSKEEKNRILNNKVNDLVNCPICLDMIEDAMETPCCNNIF